MKQELAQIALVVRDYDEAIAWYREKLLFELIEDTQLSPTKRWVVMAPPGSNGCKILLAKAANEMQEASIGNQTGGRVFLFLHTDDFYRDYDRMIHEGVSFKREPVEEDWGIVSVFEDLYGNLWDFIQSTKK